MKISKIIKNLTLGQFVLGLIIITSFILTLIFTLKFGILPALITNNFGLNIWYILLGEIFQVVYLTFILLYLMFIISDLLLSINWSKKIFKHHD